MVIQTLFSSSVSKLLLFRSVVISKKIKEKEEIVYKAAPGFAGPANESNKMHLLCGLPKQYMKYVH